MVLKRKISFPVTEKDYLKLICNFIHRLGLADCWYEKEIRYSIFNKAFSLILNIFSVIFTVNILAANYRTDLTLKESNDVLIFSYGLPAICLKVIILYAKKDDIKVFFKKLLEGEVTQKPNTKAIRAAIVVYVVVCCGFLSATVQMLYGIKDYVVEGIPVRVEVLYYPKASDAGLLVNFIRFLALVHFWYIICIMNSTDYLCLCTLVFIKYKFIRVRMFFESLGKKSKSGKEFEKEFLDGVKLLKHAFWCARNVQNTIGSIYSVQIVESITLLVVLLLKSVVSFVVFQKSLTSYAGSDMALLLVCLGSYISIVILTGVYMTYSANITYEALQVSTAIFHCGWEKVKIRPGLRKLVVVTLQQSQKPLYMTAFGVINLSYENFLVVLRLSYSFFVVMRDSKSTRT
ncbi:odorant receptor Or2-like [Pieris rapae]|uniref:odorant receptor Or2-like n=1 Tax=Pieris rapae TaxID=64459 RepID=UPI001E2815B9|nr:odorant receptor Or2-like [Pieris rapae]